MAESCANLLTEMAVTTHLCVCVVVFFFAEKQLAGQFKHLG